MPNTYTLELIHSQLGFQDKHRAQGHKSLGPLYWQGTRTQDKQTLKEMFLINTISTKIS